MPLIIRPIEASDYSQAVDIHNKQNEPDWHLTVDRMKAIDERNQKSIPEYTRIVAIKDEAIVGTAYITSHWGNFYQPQHYWTQLSTQAGYRHQGIDNAMVSHLLQTVKEGMPEYLWTCIRADFVPVVEFLEYYSFCEEFRSWGSHLNVPKFDFTPFQDLRQGLEKQGVQFICYADLPALDKESRLVAFHQQIENDVPFYEPIIPREHDDIRSDNIPDESCFVALADEEIIGMASLDTDDPQLLQNGLTGVHPSYCNRGIATVLKALVAQYAQEVGHVDINAAGSGDNQAMLQVNRKLGYDIEPAWITFRAKL